MKKILAISLAALLLAAAGADGGNLSLCAGRLLQGQDTHHNHRHAADRHPAAPPRNS